MSRENREQIPTEYNEEETQRTLRKQDNIEGERRDKTISDFPQTAALGQVLKDLEFPADKNSIVSFAQQSNRPESQEVMPVLQRLDERKYRNVSEVTETAHLIS